MQMLVRGRLATTVTTPLFAMICRPLHLMALVVARARARHLDSSMQMMTRAVLVRKLKAFYVVPLIEPVCASAEIFIAAR
jgi:hypothetical protein